MKRFVGILLAAGSAAALAGMAQAQPGGGGPRAILFEQPNFQGRSITIVEGSPNLGDGSFAARAMSARFDGDWTVCDAPDLDGRCVTARGYVANLAQLGLGRIASMGGNASDDAQSDSYRQPAAAMANADTPSERAVSEAADDEQVPGARVGGRYGTYDAPPPAPPTTAAQPVGPAPVAVVQAADAPPPAALAAAAARPRPRAPGRCSRSRSPILRPDRRRAAWRRRFRAMPAPRRCSSPSRCTAPPKCRSTRKARPTSSAATRAWGSGLLRHRRARAARHRLPSAVRGCSGRRAIAPLMT